MIGRLEIGGLEYFVCTWASAPGEGTAADAGQVAGLLHRVAGDDTERHRLRLWLVQADIDLAHADEVAVLEAAVDAGLLRVYTRRPPPSPILPRESHEAAEGEPSEPEPPPEYDWIEVELVDEDEVPIAGASFELTLPDGSVRRARTNDRGRFLVPRTDGGQCQFRWMKLHPVERAPKFVAAMAAASAEV